MSTRLTAFLLAHVPHSAQPLTRRRATQGSRDLAGGVRPTLARFPWDYLVHPGIRFGRVVMCFVEVSRREYKAHRLPLSTCASQCTASHSQACHSRRPSFAGVARPTPRGSPGTI